MSFFGNTKIEYVNINLKCKKNKFYLHLKLKLKLKCRSELCDNFCDSR